MENLRGSLLMTGSMLGFALQDVLNKILGHHLPIGQVILLLGVLGTLIFAVATRAKGVRLFDRRLLTPAFILRAVSEPLATAFYITAITLTPLAQASAIQQALPLMLTLAAALFLSEQVGWRRWLAISVGFVGVMVVIRPGTSGFSALSLLSFISVLWMTARDLITRKLPPEIDGFQIATWGFAAIIPAGFAVLLFRGDALTPMSAGEWGMAAVAVSFGALAYYLLIAAVRMGEISVVTPFRYTRLIFAVAFGWAFFAERPDEATLLGGAIIVLSGLYSLWRESRLHRRAAAARDSARS